MSCPDCFRGTVRQDKPATGQVVELHGRRAYVAVPLEGRTVKGVVVIVPDAFGWEFHNNRLLVDEYAKSGDFKVYLPDFMDGNAAPVWLIDALDSVLTTESAKDYFTKPYYIAIAAYGFIPFLIRNRIGVSMPKVTSFLEGLRRSEAASLSVGVAGFCWGGQHVVRLATEAPSDDKALVDAFFTAHPSALKIPKDITGIKKPLSIAVGDKDTMLSVEQAREIEAVLRQNKVANQVVIYEGAGHGFSVRIDRKNEKQVEQAVQAEQQAVKWFTKCFQKE